jgi:CoA:oxalate CoA-transferase
MDRPALAEDPRFSNNSARNDNHAPLKACIEAWSSTRSVAEVVAALQRHDVPCSPILSVADAAGSAQARERALLRQTSTPDGRPISVMTQPVKFSGMPASSRLAPPALGADGPRILADLLDMTPDEIAGLASQGVLHGA